LDEVKDYTKQLQSYAYGPYEVMESLEEFLKGYKEGDYAYIMTDTLSMVYLYEETYLKDKAWMIDKKISLEKFKKEYERRRTYTRVAK
jgi:hypothetical protein